MAQTFMMTYETCDDYNRHIINYCPHFTIISRKKTPSRQPTYVEGTYSMLLGQHATTS